MQKSNIIELACISGLLQVVLIVLKISKIAAWSWALVFWPTWLPLSILATIAAGYVLYRRLFPEKKRPVYYTSNKWQETLAEMNYSRLN